MLIVCPECGGKISDKADVCIHCGFPIEKTKTENYVCVIDNKPYNFFVIFNNIKNNAPRGMVINSIYNLCKISLSDAEKLYDSIVKNQTIPEGFEREVVTPSQPNRPKCPTCQSINIRKIDAIERGMSVAALGIYSKKINN